MGPFAGGRRDFRSVGKGPDPGNAGTVLPADGKSLVNRRRSAGGVAGGRNLAESGDRKPSPHPTTAHPAAKGQLLGRWEVMAWKGWIVSRQDNGRSGKLSMRIHLSSVFSVSDSPATVSKTRPEKLALRALCVTLRKGDEARLGAVQIPLGSVFGATDLTVSRFIDRERQRAEKSSRNRQHSLLGISDFQPLG